MKKVAVVSGASHGIGEAISKKLLDKNYKVYGISRTNPKNNSPQFVWIKADLTKANCFKIISEKIKDKKISLLVNNAGTAFSEEALNFTDKSFYRMFGLNFVAPIKLASELLPRLSDGIIVNISSLSDRFPDPLWALYGSTKAAINIYFETVAAEYENIKVVNILPSYVDTPLLRSLHKNDKNFSWKSTNKPEQTAEIISYIIDKPSVIDSGSRVITVSSNQDHRDYDPEKLYLFLTDKKKLTRIK